MTKTNTNLYQVFPLLDGYCSSSLRKNKKSHVGFTHKYYQEPLGITLDSFHPLISLFLNFVKTRNIFKKLFFHRNLPLQNMDDFRSFIHGLGFKFFEHGVTGYRTPLGSHVYTASDDPPEVTMEPHNECSYSPLVPRKV